MPLADPGNLFGEAPGLSLDLSYRSARCLVQLVCGAGDVAALP